MLDAHDYRKERQALLGHRKSRRPDHHLHEKKLLLGAADPRSADGLAAGF